MYNTNDSKQLRETIKREKSMVLIEMLELADCSFLKLFIMNPAIKITGLFFYLGKKFRSYPSLLKY